MNGGVPTAYSQSAGTTTVNGSLIADTVAIDGGTLKGDGVVTSDVTNNSVVAAGNSPGFLDIVGDYTQTATGTLLIEIAGTV
jgi:hypothetical protein